MQCNVVIFDFDGTLADTMTAMLAIYNDVAPRFGCTPIDLDDVETIRSQRPQEIMHRYGVTLWKLPFLAFVIQSRFKKRASSVRPHNGIPEALRALKERGATLGVLTSNSGANVRAFLREQSLDDVFDFVVSYRNLFGKDRALRRIMRHRGIDAVSVAYVGDETRDMEAARRAGVLGIAVTWGFQNRDAFNRVHPDVIVDAPSQLIDMLTLGERSHK